MQRYGTKNMSVKTLNKVYNGRESPSQYRKREGLQSRHNYKPSSSFIISKENMQEQRKMTLKIITLT